MKADIKKPNVVVIIPYYNGSKWIEKAIKSVMNQSVKADEFIIVNDGSKAEEREALEVLKKHYPFSIRDKENGGQGSARNLGVSTSTSRYICFLDQDDFFMPNHIEDLLNIIPADDPLLGYIYADVAIADSQGNITNPYFLKNMPKPCSPHPKHCNIETLLRYDMFVLPSAALISRSAFDTIGGFDEQFMGYEDDDFFLRLFQAGFTSYFLDKAVTVWYANLESTSFSIKMAQSRLKYFKKLSHAFGNAEMVKDYLVPRFQKAFLYELYQANINNSSTQQAQKKIVKEYASTIYSNTTINLKHKLKLAMIVFALQSVFISKLIFKMLLVRKMLCGRKKNAVIYKR